MDIINNNDTTNTLPKGSVSDNLELFITLAKQNEDDIMSSSPRRLLDEVLQQTPHKHTYRHADVVLVRTAQMTLISLPSGGEIYSGATVAMDLMSIASNIGEEDDLIMYAECMDNMVHELRKREKEKGNDTVVVTAQ